MGRAFTVATTPNYEALEGVTNVFRTTGRKHSEVAVWATVNGTRTLIAYERTAQTGLTVELMI